MVTRKRLSWRLDPATGCNLFPKNESLGCSSVVECLPSIGVALSTTLSVWNGVKKMEGRMATSSDYGILRCDLVVCECMCVGTC